MKLLCETKFPARGCNAAGAVVLRDKREGQHMRYVTHWRNDETGGHCHGHYFDNFLEARTDYRRRVAAEIKMHKAD